MSAMTFRYRISCAFNWTYAPALTFLAEETLRTGRNAARIMRDRTGLQSCEPSNCSGLCGGIHQTVIVGNSMSDPAYEFK